MDLHFSPEHETFRQEIQAFLSTNWQFEKDAKPAPEAIKAFRQLATEQGYLYRGVPKNYGGGEQPADVLKAQIIAQEFRRAGAPTEVLGVGTQMLVPTLLECGEEWQRERFVRKTIEGEYRWCQGYSEPNSGSDLASLRTRGELVGDEWVINGQKVWTSYARDANYMFALVRTEPEAPKHAGLSYLLIDLNQPGIDIRPLKQINGGTEFNEVFLENVRTPASWIVGPRGGGWKVSRSLLKHERNMIGSLDRSDALFASLLGLARRVQRDGAPALQDSAVRDRLAMLAGHLEVQRYSNYIQLTRESRGQSAGLLQMLNKLSQSNFGHLVAQTSLDLVQNDALLTGAPGRKLGNERWMNQYMGSLASSIAGGTSNIQRNIIAERGLGLPRDAANPTGEAS
ncbi:acyl-CoA dehydrogenase family protein [Noviherbaspirillum sedimenti]|uniref:Acyl-CoA dehydrogenase n=1 Tax=Noviherbaspirillum sedimenti TaxID=2320865 RepID=A0A3A3GEI2_9BURK|nr:acyl-CoA dehydrogenase family protein [Noviherbaspirillum sedimenti]RJG00646.1 acyl-CoA dehydrogenase [Noviherbaspirillum sedimenti]